MKKLFFATVIVLALSGCGGGGSTPYSVIGRDEGTVQVTYRVQVPAGATQSDMSGWARELEAKENGKSTMVNFYDGPRSTETLIASYQGGNLYDMQPGR